MTDNQVRNQNSWDEKYSALLQKLDDYQEEKDNPRKQVVDMEMDELLVGPLSFLALYGAAIDDDHVGSSSGSNR